MSTYNQTRGYLVSARAELAEALHALEDTEPITKNGIQELLNQYQDTALVMNQIHQNLIFRDRQS